MTVTVAPFDSMPWEEGTHELERKKVVAGHSVVLIEFAPGFADPNPCERSHVLYVIQGVLELELDQGATLVRAGQCAVVEKGTRHRAKNAGRGAAVAFIVSDTSP
jgi:quercetin dioxygenase-like cupin family protein